MDPRRHDPPGSEHEAAGPGTPDEEHVLAQLRRENEALAGQVRSSRAALEGSRRALGLLGHPGLRPPAGGDYGAYFGSVAQAIVGAIADGCSIELLTPQGLRPLGLAHTDAARERDLRDAYQGDGSPRHEGAALRLPLAMRELQLGTLTVWSEPGRALEPCELVVLHSIAQQLATVLDNRRLERAADDAARATDSLLSMVSHEIRTPLATISMSVDASVHRIEASADELPKEWLLTRLQKMKKAVKRTDRLLHTFLGVSQIQLGRLVPDARDTDVAALAASVVESISDDSSWAGCQCTLHAPRPELGNWDPLQLEIVLTNLLTNAIKYAPSKPIEITIQGDAERVSITVRDHGPGVPPEQQARLFQRFSRLPSVSRVHGFGLGLWIVKHFVEANGGSVSFESEVGLGTCFRLLLPRSGARPQLSPPDPPARAESPA